MIPERCFLFARKKPPDVAPAARKSVRSLGRVSECGRVGGRCFAARLPSFARLPRFCRGRAEVHAGIHADLTNRVLRCAGCWPRLLLEDTYF
jgi:hypothetical protein